jgi:hypothetical protein
MIFGNPFCTDGFEMWNQDNERKKAEQGAALNRYHAGGSGQPRRVPAVTGSANAHPAPSAS